ncbi:hypothetical protein [Sphingomonas sp.]|uniref:hypothetical protein n=1 Tax=Sphingomonas sp. TaxID=28214 RepID=UPI002C38986F|nr:hypothetical protein [Sphingomonas sp.]HWK35381.1 hypothetical protein [Sphingomonas sp.]
MTAPPTRHRAIGALLVAFVWFSCVWFGSWEWNVNQVTRMFAALSIVEQGDATIDEYQAMTIDKARFGDHYYADKAPGMTLMALPAVAIADAATGQQAHDLSLTYLDPGFGAFLRLRLRLAVATSVALLTALAALALFDWGRALGGSAGAGLFAALGFAIGTPMWGWSTTLFGHAPVAALFVIAGWAVWRGTRDDRPAPGLALLAGLALGWAVAIEYTAVLGGLAIGLWALWRLRGQGFPAGPIAAALAGGLVGVAVVLGYNLFAFGTMFRLGYQGVVGFEGMNEGLFGLTYPKPRVLFEIIGGDRRGLIWVAPVLLLGAAGLARLVRARATRDIGVMAMAMVVLLFLYNASYAYWDGGNATGPRHVIPAVGFLALGLAPLWGAARGRWTKALALAVLGVSIALNAIIASAEILSGGRERFPLWTDVIRDRFLSGQLRTLPGEWWGWSAWTGFALWWVAAAVCAGLFAWLLRGERSHQGLT